MLKVDREQILLIGLPLFLLCTDIINLFGASPPRPPSPKPSDSLLLHEAPSEIPDSPTPVIGNCGGVGLGHTVKIEFCTSCSYKGSALTMRKMLENSFPGIDVVLENYPPPLPKKVLSKAFPVVQMGFIGIIMAGDKIFPMLGMVPPRWYHSMRSNRFGSIASFWLLGNVFQSYLLNTGAFEVSFDGEMVFSKLKEGRFPGEIELRDLIAKYWPDSSTL